MIMRNNSACLTNGDKGDKGEVENKDKQRWVEHFLSFEEVSNFHLKVSEIFIKCFLSI